MPTESPPAGPKRPRGCPIPAPKPAAEPPAPPPVDPNRPLHALSDMGNAHEFAADHADTVRYVEDQKCWVIFDGRRWVRDRGEVQALESAKRTATRLLGDARRVYVSASRRAAAAAGGPDQAAAEAAEREAKALLRHAQKLHDVKHQKNMLVAARGDPRIFVEFGDDVFDRHPHLLNCANGTIDLSTGGLRPHAREDYLTALCPTPYDPAAAAPRYLRFLTEVFPGRGDVADYVRRLSGYALTGETSDQAFYLFVGDGSNGKSILLGLWQAVLGAGFVYVVPAEALMDAGGNRHPTERVGFLGARLAVAVETQEEGALNESRIKSLTGSDPISARGCKQDFFDFRPTHKLLLATNYRPRIRGTDRGIWRRVRLVEFARRFWAESDRRAVPEAEATADRFPEADRADAHLPKALEAERAGVLADMVRQAVAFYAGDGTVPAPAGVMRATEEYRQEEDVTGQFFRDRVVATAEPVTAGKALWDAYQAWTKETGHADARNVSQKRFGQRAAREFPDKVKSHGVIRYRCRVLPP